MANELLDKPVEFEVNGNDVKLTGNTVAKYLTRGNGNVSEQEVVMFINLCKFQKLNPFLNEAYLIKFGNQPAQIIVSKEAFMKRAESHPQYDGMEAGIIVERGDEMIEIEGAVSYSFLTKSAKLKLEPTLWRIEFGYSFLTKSAKLKRTK